MSTAAPQPTSPRILLVDDEEHILTSLRLALQRMRPKPVIETAASGEEALLKLEGSQFDIIISDYRMQRASGVEVLRKARDATPGAARILVTGYYDLPDDGDAQAEEVVEYRFQKPWNLSDIYSTLSGILAKRAEAKP